VVPIAIIVAQSLLTVLLGFSSLRPQRSLRTQR